MNKLLLNALKGSGILILSHYVINLPFQMGAMNRLHKTQPEALQGTKPNFFGYIFPGHASVKRLKGQVDRTGLGNALGGALFPKIYTSVKLTKAAYGEMHLSDWITSIALPGINNNALSKKMVEKSLYQQGAEDALESLTTKQPQVPATSEKIEIKVASPTADTVAPAPPVETPPMIVPNPNPQAQLVGQMPYPNPVVVMPNQHYMPSYNPYMMTQQAMVAPQVPQTPAVRYATLPRTVVMPQNQVGNMQNYPRNNYTPTFAPMGY